MAITEHSKALAMANGFDAARVRKSVGELEAARKRHPKMHILHGLEVDILGDGELDLDDDTLALLDWVIVSIHSRFEMTPEAATARALRAVSHPAVHAFGHPTGRLIGSRESVPFDVDRVAEEAAARGVAMEINASPDRLDLSDVNARLALSRGCRFVIDTDAHAVGQLEQMRYGVFQARRAGLTRGDVLNALPWAKFRAMLAESRKRGPRPAAARPSAKPAPTARKPAAKPKAAGPAAAAEAPAMKPKTTRAAAAAMKPATKPKAARPAAGAKKGAATKVAATLPGASKPRPRPRKAR
jgi:DNA polymerase (family 10)